MSPMEGELRVPCFKALSRLVGPASRSPLFMHAFPVRPPNKPHILSAPFLALWLFISMGFGQPTPSVIPPPRVEAIDGQLELGYDIRVQISGLEAWTAAGHDGTRLVPYLNGRALRGNYPSEVHSSIGHVHFQLQIHPTNRDVWIDLLGAPDGLSRPVTFSVGPENQSPFETTLTGERSPVLTVISPPYGWISLGVVAALFGGFIWLARGTDIIRDSGPAPAARGQRKPYNLGRTQMAFWFFLTFGAYVVIWLITDAIDTITPSLLGLMGISASTALGEVLIDSNKDSAAASRLGASAAEKQALEAGVAEMQSQLAALVAKPAPTADDAVARDNLNRQLLEQRTRLNLLNQEVRALAPTTSPGVSKGFLQDLLSDGAGYSFHRFQIFGWTLALGGVFVSNVYNQLTMPEFSATLLGLMGMSSGTYIGFKFPEQR